MIKNQFNLRMQVRARTLSIIAALPFLLSMQACNKSFEETKRKEAWVPIYQSVQDVQEIKNLSPRTPIQGGKIYAWDKFLFQVEPEKGIHVYKIHDQQATPLTFIQVYGAQEISIKNGILYTNNYKDIVSLQIDNMEEVKLLQRATDVFSTKSKFELPPEPGYFQCYDESKGIIIGWELKKNIAASCKY